MSARSMEGTGGIKYKLFNFFVNVGDKYNNCKNLVCGYVTQIKRRSRVLDFLVGLIPMILLWPLNKLGNALVFKKIQAKFGGRLRIAISGGGSLQRSTENFYHSVGLNLLEGYGNDNPGAKSQGMKQLMAGGGVALIGVVLVPLLSGLFG